MIRTLACCSLVLALAACSGEPEDADATVGEQV